MAATRSYDPQVECLHLAAAGRHACDLPVGHGPDHGADDDRRGRASWSDSDRTPTYPPAPAGRTLIENRNDTLPLFSALMRDVFA